LVGFESFFVPVRFKRFMALVMHKDSSNQQMDTSKYVRYTPEQVEALERVYAECPKPSSLRRQQLIRECPILSNIEPKQIKVWFQNRRYYSICCFSSLFFSERESLFQKTCTKCFCLFVFAIRNTVISFGLGYELVVHLGKELNSYGRWVCKEVMLLIENNHFCP